MVNLIAHTVDQIMVNGRHAVDQPEPMMQFAKHKIVVKMTARHVCIDHNMMRYRLVLWKNKGCFASAVRGSRPNTHPHVSIRICKRTKMQKHTQTTTWHFYSVDNPITSFYSCTQTHDQSCHTVHTSPNVFAPGPTHGDQRPILRIVCVMQLEGTSRMHAPAETNLTIHMTVRDKHTYDE